MADVKTCYACKQSKPRAAFCKDKGSKDGRNTICKDCVRQNYRRRVEQRDARCCDCGIRIANPKAARCHRCAARHRAGHGKHVHRSGYVMLSGYWDHPNATKEGRLLEHVFVMAAHIGRPLLPKETIHHLNGVRADNRLENLELWSSGHPFGQRVSDKVAWAKRILALYDPDALAPVALGVAS